MAIIKLGPPVSGIRGTIGGITYSQNKSGPYAKIWRQPSNKRTSKQSKERGFLSRMPVLWNNLTGAQRLDWRTFAALPAQDLVNPLGDTYSATGYNWFCKCNIRLLRVARATIAGIPTQARPAAPSIVDFRVTPPGVQVDISAAGAATASSTNGVNVAQRAFDDSLVNYWQTLAIFPGSAWLQNVLPVPAIVRSYYIYSATAPNTLEDPSDWTFQVWSGGAWRGLQAVTAANLTVDAWNTFYCENPYPAATTYRHLITAVRGGATLRIREQDWTTGQPGGSVIIYPEDEFGATPDYDLILHISQGPSIGMDVQYPGYLEILATQTPGRWFTTFQTEIEAVFGNPQDNRKWFCQLFRQTTQGIRSAPQASSTMTLV